MKKHGFIALIFSLLLIGCITDDDNGFQNFDGTREAIENFVGRDIINTMTDLGLIIYPGNNPPHIEGEYLMSPTILQNSNISTDSIGKVFPDHYMNFYDQDNLEIKYTGEGGIQNDYGKGSFISGNDDKFSIFLIVRSEVNGLPVDGVYVLSGRVTNEGFVTFQNAAFMKDNHGNPAGVFIENGKGRIFTDADGLVDRL